MYSEQSKGPLVLTVIAGLVGTGLIFFGEFGGWYDYTYHGSGVSSREWGSVGFWNAPGAYSLFFLLGGGGLIFCLVVAVLALNDSEKVTEYNLIQWGRMASIGVFVLIFIGGGIFITEMTAAEYDSWWMSEAFYGGLACAALSAIFLFLVKKPLAQQYARPHPAPQYPPPQPAPAAAPGGAQFCTNCGSKTAGSGKFCVTCGNPIED
jgi:hypothetical protein